MLQFCSKTEPVIAKTSNSLQLSVSDMLTHVNFPSFAMVVPHFAVDVTVTLCINSFIYFLLIYLLS